MSYFQQDIITIMNADASLNLMVDFIFPKRLAPKTDESANTIIVYDFDIESSDEDNTGSIFQTWSLEVYVGGNNYDTVYKAADRLKNYLKSYRGQNIDKLTLSHTSEEFDNEDEIYVVRLYFDVIYQN